MSRNTWEMAQFKEEDKTQPPPVEFGPPSKPVHPELLAFRRSVGNLRLPIDAEREVRLLRRMILQLAEVVYDQQPTEQPTKGQSK
jgi:hypothetical protein